MMKKTAIYLSIVVIVLLAMSAAAFLGAPSSDGSEDDATGTNETKGIDDLCGDNCTLGGFCEAITCAEGNSGTISIPLVGVNFVETDKKHHWQMPDGKVKVEATLNWESGWELQFDIGLGECPHSGTLLETETSSSGQITLIYEAESGETLDTSQWFAHVAVPDVNAYRGESCDYSFEISLCSLTEEGCDSC